MLLQFRVKLKGLTNSGGVGAITRASDYTWWFYAVDEIRDSGWQPVPVRGGFLAPAEALAGVPPDTQDAIKAIYRAGLVPDIASLSAPKLRPGEYHPRIWRGTFEPRNALNTLPVDPVDLYGSIFVQSLTSAVSLFDALVEVFKIVEPNDSNGLVFGHRIRELLILASTEVETNLRSIYLANCPSVDTGSRLSTRQYARLRDPMLLQDWVLSLDNYPESRPLSPFRQWDTEKPTQSLAWYDAYNAVKHDRERHFSQAHLSHLLEAMAALHAVLAAQWGPTVFSRWGHNYPSPFTVTSNPSWSTEDLYVAPFPESEADWVPIPCMTR